MCLVAVRCPDNSIAVHRISTKRVYRRCPLCPIWSQPPTTGIEASAKHPRQRCPEKAAAGANNSEALFLWHIFYRVLAPTKSRTALKSPKEPSPADPFGWHVLASWAPGDRDPWSASLERVNDSATRGDLVESVCADQFRRRFGRFAYYYRSKKGREEIDFALFEDNACKALVEVKQQNRIRKKHRSTLADHGGGLLAVRHTDDLA